MGRDIVSVVAHRRYGAIASGGSEDRRLWGHSWGRIIGAPRWRGDTDHRSMSK
jgi:hypothetical protein